MCEINHFKIYVLYNVVMWQMMLTTYLSKELS
jgi:hypothetical protein